MSLIQFLVERNAISGPLALAALDRFRRTRVPLGRLAMQEDLLGIGACIHILDRQAEEANGGRRRRFGEVAVSLGYLSSQEVGWLLERQRSLGPSMGSILLDLGGAESELLVSEIRAYEGRVAASDSPPGGARHVHR